MICSNSNNDAEVAAVAHAARRAPEDELAKATPEATPSLHNKIPAYNIFARGWVAQKSFCSQVVAKIFQGLGPKRRES